MKIINNQKGQSLFEVVVAIGLIGVALVAVVGLLVQGQQNTTLSKDRSAGARAVVEVTEWLRSERDTDWGAFRTRANNSPTWCLNTLTWPSTTGVCGANAPDQPFAKEVTLTPDANNPNCMVKATVRIKWLGGDDTVDTTEYILTNWKGGC
jgi:type II secretory pathway pseudopilin PulG